MRKVIGVFLLLASILLLRWGQEASDSRASRISVLFTGALTNRTVWHVVGGAACLAIGLGLLALPKPTGRK